jgi:hypothetical protein
MDKKSLLLLHGKIKSKAQDIPELEMDYFKHLNTRHKGADINEEESREAIFKAKQFKNISLIRQKNEKEVERNNELIFRLNRSKREFKNDYREADNAQEKEKFKKRVLQLQTDITELQNRNAHLEHRDEELEEAQQVLRAEYGVLVKDNEKTKKAINKVVKTDMKPDMRKKKNKTEI